MGMGCLGGGVVCNEVFMMNELFLFFVFFSSSISVLEERE